jgi:4-hydroxyacetophenone monooxygenase
MTTNIDIPSLLASADRRTLAAVVTHLAEDPKTVPDLRDRARIEELAAQLLPSYLAGEKTAGPPSDEVLQAAMNLAAGEKVPAEYGPMVREQMGIGPAVAPQPLNPPADFHVVIIGAGVSGVLAGLKLDQMGLSSFTILEKNPEPGGTWWQNSYPGCRVDTPSLLYSYSFAPDRGWPEHFSHQPDLLNYVKDIVATHNFGDRLQCNTSVESMAWNDENATWDLDIRRSDGSVDHIRANFVIGATGLLRISKLPDIEGVNAFAGPSFHSTHWNHDIDLTGKRVAVIGAGASANQIVPAIAPITSEVLIYQRTPHWMLSHPQYGKALSGTERMLIDKIPTYLSWFRFRQFWQIGDAILPTLRIDPDWPYPERSVNATNDKLRGQLTEYIKMQLGDRPELIEKVLPTYPPYGKRLLLDNGWYQALLRDDVRLITEPIQRITADGITTSAGHEKVDVVVFASGFDTGLVLWPIQVTGRGGVNVRKQLDERLEAYQGTAIEHCPNLFITPGPNGTPGHGGSGIFFAECQVGYIIECLRAMFDHKWKRIEVRGEAVRAFVDEVSAELKHYVWSLPGISNWFRGTRDRVTAIIPKRLIDLWQEGKAPKMNDYIGG